MTYSNRSDAPKKGSSKRTQPVKRKSGRAFGLFLFFLAIALILIARLAYVQIVKADEYSAAAEEQRTSDITLPATRGTIYDRNGNVVATTIEATTIYANPNEITDAQSTAETIASILGGTADDYIGALSKEGVSFAYVKRKADVDLAAQLEDLDLDGIYFLDDSKRVYPYDGVGNQILGVTDLDDSGISGIELEYNDVLTGEDGQLLVQRGLGGTPISGGVTAEVDAVDGEDVILSVDIDLQQYIEKALAEAVSTYSAEGGSITVYDGATGEIYASSSAPLLNSENWRDSETDAYVLKTISNAYEPGSTFKAITASSLLNEGAITSDTIIQVPSQLPIDDFVIKDSSAHGDLTLTFAQVIARSSNIGTVIASHNISTETFYQYIQKFGFTQNTGVDFPGSSTGSLLPLESWTSATAANVPFGQGISVSALQLIRAYGVFTNGGVLCTPHFLLDIPQADEDTTWATQEVITSATADTMTQILEGVVSNGTAASAAMEDYTVAGKSGTAQMASSDGGYLSDKYVISFCGYLPNTDSNLVCLVTLEAPTCSTVGPIFADVMGYVTDHYKIEPDIV